MSGAKDELSRFYLWSIAVEEQFYLCAPLLVTLLPFGRSIYLWIAVAMTTIATGGSRGDRRRIFAHHADPRHGLRLRGAILCGRRRAPVRASHPAHTRDAMVRRRLLPALSQRLDRDLCLPRGKRYAIPEGWYYQAMLVLTAVVAAAVFHQLIDRNIMANRSLFYSKRLGWTRGALAYTLAATGILYGRYEIGQRVR